VVLGAGGVLGAAWTIGALAAIGDVEGFEAHDADVIVGTSAGSVLAGLLGSGLTVANLLDHQRGIPLPHELGDDWEYDSATGGARPPRPGLGVGSPALLRQSVRNLRKLPPLAVLAALTPTGKGNLAQVGRMMAAVSDHTGWVARDGVWVVAMDYDSGRRVAFGRDGAPAAPLAEAVMASCAIPGWYAPVTIGDRRYVDGGTLSPTSIDLVAREELDEVYVLAPMASFVSDRPRQLTARLERQLRRRITRRMLAEAQKVSRRGAAVTVLTPGPEDLAVIGANLMDPSRRLAVLETSLRTSTHALRHPRPDDLGVAL
jgi:NTE family protein